MLANTVRDRLLAVPFVPFVIQMTDGRRFTVPHPDFASVSPKGSTVTVYSDDDGGMVLSSLLIASVEFLRPAAAAKRKGRGK